MKAIRNMPQRLLALSLLAASFAAGAQNEMPAVGTGPDGEMPAIKNPGVATPPGETLKAAESAGTTIFGGERESPIGLYITPWRDSRAEDNIDRPARLLQEQLKPIDKTVFNRQVEYYEALANALKKKGVVTPVSR